MRTLLHATAEEAGRFAPQIEQLAALATQALSFINGLELMLQLIGNRTEATESLCGATLERAAANREAIDASAEGMALIEASFSALEEAVRRLVGRVSGIGEILASIDKVARQTRLLSLNASILAARAGQHGLGFAVVAGEIKNLASQTHASTRDIAAIIEGIQTEAEHTRSAMKGGSDAVENGRRRFEAATSAIDDVQHQIAETHGHVVQIDAATKEQFGSLGQLATILAEFSRISAQAAETASRQLEKSTEMEALLEPS